MPDVAAEVEVVVKEDLEPVEGLEETELLCTTH